MKNRKIQKIEITEEILQILHTFQLEMLLEVDRICKKHNIKYSLDGGTLLGAVRHGGFIPWDDDIDIIMTRNEYERFFKICAVELNNEKFFLQEHRTDPYYRVGYSRIRRKNTTYIRYGQEKFKHQTGILIDLFVLDNMPDCIPLRYIVRLLNFCFRKILWSKTGKIVSSNIFSRILYSIISLIPAKFAFGGFDTLSRCLNKKQTELICHYAMTYPNPKINSFGISADYMKDFTSLEFEGHTFMVVAKYKEYLSQLYDNYMELPPIEKRKPHVCLSKLKAN